MSFFGVWYLELVSFHLCSLRAFDFAAAHFGNLHVLSFYKSCIQHLGIYNLLVYVLLHIGSSRLTLADWAEPDHQ